ncbi:hypothetical protein BJV74DRAFT_793300 [Russula compacta]|nr:hypothetical protein BJV74DRAFT_793300 [Russula compacta]
MYNDVFIPIGQIEKHPKKLVTAFFLFLSCNDVKGMQMATEEELLQEIINELKDTCEMDNEAHKNQLQEDSTILYPKFMEAFCIMHLRWMLEVHGANEEVLAKIEQCFINNYYDLGNPHSTLFSLNSVDNQNQFTHYCTDVDQVLCQNGSTAPKYAREYFAYYSIWQMRKYTFLMLLGTATMSESLDHLATKYQQGLCECKVTLIDTMSEICGIVHQYSYHVLNMHLLGINHKWKGAHHLRSVSIAAAMGDILLISNVKGIRRKICHIILSHLTTSIVKIDIYLKTHDTQHGTIKDLSAFKHLTAKHHITLSTKLSLKERKALEQTNDLANSFLQVFLDNIPVDANRQGETYKADNLVVEFNAAAKSTGSKNDPIQVFIEQLKRNKPLECLDPDAPTRVIETLAYEFISGLLEIMCKNSAQIKHDKNKDKDGNKNDFDMSKVKIPDIPQWPHAISSTYRGHLGYDKWTFKHSMANDDGTPGNIHDAINKEQGPQKSDSIYINPYTHITLHQLIISVLQHIKDLSWMPTVQYGCVALAVTPMYTYL